MIAKVLFFRVSLHSTYYDASTVTIGNLFHAREHVLLAHSMPQTYFTSFKSATEKETRPG
jgi:hypothetical protein